MHSLGDLGWPFAQMRSPRGSEQKSDGMCHIFKKPHSAFKK